MWKTQIFGSQWMLAKFQSFLGPGVAVEIGCQYVVSQKLCCSLTQSNSFRKQIKHSIFACWRLPIQHPVQEVVDEISWAFQLQIDLSLRTFAFLHKKHSHSCHVKLHECFFFCLNSIFHFPEKYLANPTYFKQAFLEKRIANFFDGEDWDTLGFWDSSQNAAMTILLWSKLHMVWSDINTWFVIGNFHHAIWNRFLHSR